jgi:molecular chaperone HscB
MLTKDPFETLGIEPAFALDLPAVERRHRELSRALHPDRYVGRPAAERRQALSRAIEVNEAWRLLKDPVRRAEALLAKRGIQIAEGEEPRAEPELLMRMMELREQLSEARRNGDLRSVAALATQVAAEQERVLAGLAARFAEAQQNGSAELLPLLGELRYYRRFLDEASAIEDELE